MSDKRNSLSGLSRRLAKDGILSKEQLQKAVLDAHRDHLSLVTHLVERGLAKAGDVAWAAADEFGYPLFDISAISKEYLPTDLVNHELSNKHRALPIFKRGNRLFIAMSDPTNLKGVEEIRFNTGLSVSIVVVEDDKLGRLIESAENDAGTKAFEGLDDSLDGLETVDTEEANDVTQADAADDAPIVRFINDLLLKAIKGGASDLHFEPYEKSYRVRFREDGVLKEIIKPQSAFKDKISARLKVMAKLDISERRIPQDGRIKLKISKTRAIDFRVNTCPTLWGEKIVLRILDPESAKMGIDALGYEEDQKQLYMDALNRPQGLVLVTGPTGSGKTVSLYTGVNILNTPELNISTAEDPVEINLEGVNQVNVNPKQGMNFSSALRAFLRQDPDVILVGEIRDLETAEIAIKAAQTGHLVLSTLHTNSASETLTRLRNMGVPSFNIATSVVLIIAQRLARRLCSHCKKPVTVPQQSLLEMGFTEQDINAGMTIFEPVGCERCNDGYKGRTGIYEVVRITDALQRLIMEDGNSIEISDQCRAEGFNDLARSGLMKVMQGITSLAEVNRVTSGN